MKKVKRVLPRDLPEAFVRRIKALRPYDDVSEIMLDYFYMYVLQPVSKSTFVDVFFRLLSTFCDDGSMHSRIMLSAMTTAAFKQLEAHGAIIYKPRKHLLPGENHEY